MATIDPMITQNGDGSVVYFVYEALTETNDNGAPIEWTEYADRSIHFVGDFGTGGTIQWQGSNDGTNWLTLNDADGNPISKTATALEAVMELSRYARPYVSEGTSVDLDVYVVCRRANPMRT